VDSWDIGRFFKLATTGNVQGIATDFAGNIYLVEHNANKIARLSPDTNTVTEWSIPTKSSGPTGIAFDSSTGNLYFSERNANKIGRFLPSNGAFTEWTVNNKPASSLFINSPGNLYFISENGIIYRLS
jgi:virginiamycin B lyase